ncbi:hypothetical protein ACQ3G6_05015 [Allorhizobium undicola]
MSRKSVERFCDADMRWKKHVVAKSVERFWDDDMRLGAWLSWGERTG